jgi:hypothetical protein
MTHLSTMPHNLQYLHRHQIDTSKWDHCIDTAANGLIYARSVYLDHMTTAWDALVLGDYEAVMPLPARKKWGIQYIYQPAFIASLGVFGSQLSQELTEQFIHAIPNSFKLIDLRLNYGNNFSQLHGVARLHNNYVLSLHSPYEQLFKQYRENIRRNIKKAQQLGNRYAKDIAVEEVAALARQQMDHITDLTHTDYDNFIRLYHALKQQGRAMACGVYTQSGELVASCVYFFSNKRAYYILVGNHPNGRTLGASHYLIDRFIHDQAGQDLLLDFEGSDIRNLAFFYESFGAETEIYPSIWVNRMPWWARWAK